MLTSPALSDSTVVHVPSLAQNFIYDITNRTRTSVTDFVYVRHNINYDKRNYTIFNG